jgi:hypothetical protein
VFTVDDTVHFFLRFAINLNIELGWVYGLGCSFF